MKRKFGTYNKAAAGIEPIRELRVKLLMVIVKDHCFRVVQKVTKLHSKSQFERVVFCETFQLIFSHKF